MFQGRFNATMKILLNSNIGHTVDDKILHELQQKHPNLSQNIEGDRSIEFCYHIWQHGWKHDFQNKV